MRRGAAILAVVALAASACGGDGSARPSPSATPSGIAEPADGILVTPTSTPAPSGVAVPLMLAHCGFSSPVDFDGSLWEAVDWDRDDPPAALVNADDGTITVDGNAGVYETSQGERITIRRVDGPRRYDPCM